MASRLGENIEREWDAEPFAVELWEALSTLKLNRALGVNMLSSLAEQGSPLAMMYLGHHLRLHGDVNAMPCAEMWLSRSAQAGSIEGRYQLAHHHQRSGNGAQTVAELKTLASKGYGPAMYALGAILYEGELVRRDIHEAVNYLKMGKASGHLPSAAFLSKIYRKEKFGLRGRIASHWLCLAKIPALLWYALRYPNSDRLRPLFPRAAD